MASGRQRLDELLLARGLAASRTQAKALIMSGRVFHETARLDKPGKEVPSDIILRMEQAPRFVSRGGEKLQGWIDAHGLEFAGAHVLDVGASTGGFTDCALQAGAAGVTCLDVGRAQLHAKLRGDPRVKNIERVNARHLRPGDLPRDEYGIIVMDLSFISLRSVLPSVWPFLAAGGTLVALVKPQFEAGKDEADKGHGVIRDPLVHQRVLEGIVAFALAELSRANLIATMPSPITGSSGNREFLIGLLKGM